MLYTIKYQLIHTNLIEMLGFTAAEIWQTDKKSNEYSAFNIEFLTHQYYRKKIIFYKNVLFTF